MTSPHFLLEKPLWRETAMEKNTLKLISPVLWKPLAKLHNLVLTEEPCNGYN